MEKRDIDALIMTRSAPLADGLEALLRSGLQFDSVSIAHSLEKALQHIEEQRPRLVLLDVVLLGDMPEAHLENIHRLSPETQRALLVDDVQAVRWVPQYAEAILVNGISPPALAAIVTSLLTVKGD